MSARSSAFGLHWQKQTVHLKMNSQIKFWGIAVLGVWHKGISDLELEVNKNIC